jgi:hypothetical protein
MQTAYQWLVDNGVSKSLLHWADPSFGVLRSGANITRIFDLGSTYLPRGLDLTTTSPSNTTYSTAGLNSLIPAFTNANGSSYLYWGRNARFNQIRWRQQLTIAALYERTQTSSNICFAGVPTSSTVGTWVSNPTNFNQGHVPKFNGPLIAGTSLVHSSGTPGTIQFNLSGNSTTVTASVTASGATTQIAIGTYDGTTMKAYSDATGGTGVTSLPRDPLFAGESSLAGCRKGGSRDKPVLCVGDTLAISSNPNPTVPPFDSSQIMTSPFSAYAHGTLAFTNAFAQFKASCIIVLGVGLDSTKAASLYNLLKTRAGI